MVFSDIQLEISRRATKDQSGTQFTQAIKNAANFALFRAGREGPWRCLRRRTFFSTTAPYSTGTGHATFTVGSTTIAVVGATFLTDGIEIGRRVKLSGDSIYHTIRTIPTETTFTIEKPFSGTATTTGTYSILGQEDYSLPIASGHRMFMWHEEYGFPLKMQYVTDQDFYERNIINTNTNIPIAYRMWGEDMIIAQTKFADVVRVVSSSTSDTAIAITVFGIVSGYPDFEIINLNGTTGVNGAKSFSSVERIVKNGTTIGRVTATTNSAKTTLSVLPVGGTMVGTQLRKIGVWPLPTTAFPVNLQYYKDPTRLVNSGDVHEMGEDFDEAIILLATAKLKSEQNQGEGIKLFSLYQDEIKNLKKTNLDKIDWFPHLRRPFNRSNDFVASNLQYMQVGANYGPTVW